jgi:hypothetical protein
MSEQGEYLCLKWGTLKEWDIKSDEARKLLQRYFDLGTAGGAMQQRDTPQQKALICALIDVLSADTVYLDWDGRDVPKEEAKRYVMEYRR